MTHMERTVKIDISRIPVAGVGGLGLVAVAVLVSVLVPAAGWLMASGVAGGGLLGIALVLARRRAENREPDGRAPSVLFVESPFGHRQRPREGESYKRM